MFENAQAIKPLLTTTEIIAVLVSIIYYNNVKHTYWRWFTYYLILVVLGELVVPSIAKVAPAISAKYICNLIQIPLEFLFLFWLYGMKSLKFKNFYILSVWIYIISLILESVFSDNKGSLLSVSYSIGIAFLILYVIFEFIVQIRSEKILNFSKDKMFYINVGVIIGYIGNFPYHAYYSVLYYDFRQFWNLYSFIFYITFSIMYLLFAASFIWGKPNL